MSYFDMRTHYITFFVCKTAADTQRGTNAGIRLANELIKGQLVRPVNGNKLAECVCSRGSLAAFWPKRPGNGQAMADKLN